MSLHFQENQRVKIKKIVETKDNYSVVHLSSSRKKSDYEKKQDKESLEKLEDGSKLSFLYNGDYAYSDWGYVRFVGKAHSALSNLNEGDVVTIKGFEKQEPYEKDGKIEYPKTSQRFVYECEPLRSTNGSTKPKVELPKEDDIPF